MPPKVKIPMHVFVFGVASVPGVAYALYWKRNHDSDEAFEQKLQENFHSNIQGNRDKKQDMVKFFQAMKDQNNNPEHDKKMMSILQGGRGDIKRHYAVDEKLYGTEEGVMKKKEAEEAMMQDLEEKKQKRMEKKKKHKKKRKQTSDAEDNENNSNSTNTSENESEEKDKGDRKSETVTGTRMRNLPNAQQAAISAVAIGSLAAVATLLSGKKGS
mmetsp:Transcript_19577/g.24690  ORF Transcript_19577/g.24690 Transcript_19577/m.24690 type:complete len:214 (+) Transcript_19577:94-735(+)